MANLVVHRLVIRAAILVGFCWNSAQKILIIYLFISRAIHWTKMCGPFFKYQIPSLSGWERKNRRKAFWTVRVRSMLVDWIKVGFQVERKRFESPGRQIFFNFHFCQFYHFKMIFYLFFLCLKEKGKKAWAIKFHVKHGPIIY